MTKLDSSEIIDRVNKLQKYDLLGDYDLYIDKFDDGDYIRTKDIRTLIILLMFEAEHK